MKNYYIWIKNGDSQIYKNPSRKELKQSGINYWRVVESDDGNYYFGDAFIYVHSSIADKAEDYDNADFAYAGEYDMGFNVILYNGLTNTFYYRCDYMNMEEYNQYLQEAKEMFNTPYFKQMFGKYKVEVINEESPWDEPDDYDYDDMLYEAIFGEPLGY